MPRSVEDLWNIPIAHGCSWLPPNSRIPPEDRHRYQSVNPPIHLVYSDYEPKPVAWDEKIEQAGKLLRLILKNHKNANIERRVNEAGYFLTIANPENLDLSQAKVRFVPQRTRGGKQPEYIEVFIPVLAGPVKTTWFKRLLSRVRTLVERYY